MKITMSFSVGSAEDLAAARNLFDRLSFAEDDEVEDSLPPTGDAPPPPAPPPPTAAPPAPPPPAAGPPPPNVELDSEGRAWDEKFHAKSKTQIKDGTWRRKKGVTKVEVEAGLPATLPADPPAVVPPTPPLAPPPPAANGQVTWGTVVEAFQTRSKKYTQEQTQAALRAVMIEPTTLHGSTEQYAAAVAALDAACPM